MSRRNNSGGEGEASQQPGRFFPGPGQARRPGPGGKGGIRGGSRRPGSFVPPRERIGLALTAAKWNRKAGGRMTGGLRVRRARASEPRAVALT